MEWLRKHAEQLALQQHHSEDGASIIEHWLCNRSTKEFLGLWVLQKTHILSLPRKREPSQINELDGRSSKLARGSFSRLCGNDEFLAPLWEKINKPDFKGGEFDPFINAAGSNSFTPSPKKKAIGYHE